jgi:hypothetical protein
MKSPLLLLCFVTVVGLACLAGLGCSRDAEGSASTTAAVSGVPIGDIRGVVDVSDTLKARIFDDADPMTAQFDVSRVAGAVFRLRKQLGVFAPEGTISTYQGGIPTPLRMTLWHQVFTRFATATAGLCTATDPVVTFPVYAKGPSGTITQPTSFRVNAAFADEVKKTCSYSGDQLARREVAGELWDTVMGLGGTLAEDRASFLTDFADDASPALAASPADRVTDMMQSMLLNPHFLLAK